MPAPSSPTWLHAATHRRASYANLRISDAERSEVADLLSKHYGDGRLDQAEFDERIEQAMKAKTYSDLSGLFADLPRTGASEASPAPDGLARPRRGRSGRHVIFLILVVVIAATAGQALVRSLVFWPVGGILAGVAWLPWLLIGFLAFLWLRHGDRR